MTHKKAGVIIAVAIVGLALLIYGVSHIKVVRKPQTDTKQPQATAVVTEVSKKQKQDKSNESSSSTSTPDSDLPLVEIIAEDKLDYSSVDQTTTGVVKSKKCYLSGNQVVHLIEIEATMGTSKNNVLYFCSYSVYEQLYEGEILNLVYRQTTANTYAVISVSRDA